MLGIYLAEDPAKIELAAAEGGKPIVADPGTSLRFNLSHSGRLALVAVTQELEVGVDVERIDPRRDVAGLAGRALDPAAAAAVCAAPLESRAAAFHEAWTRHEALVKCPGSGLHRPRPTEPVAVAAIHPGSGFAAAVAIAAEAMPTLRLFTLAREKRLG